MSTTAPATAAAAERTYVATKAPQMTARDRRPELLMMDGSRTFIASLLSRMFIAVHCGRRRSDAMLVRSGWNRPSTNGQPGARSGPLFEALTFAPAAQQLERALHVGTPACEMAAAVIRRRAAAVQLARRWCR